MGRIADYLDTIFQSEAPVLPEREKKKAELYRDSLFTDIQSFMQIDPERRMRYDEVDEMDARNPLIAKSLDIIAEEATPVEPRTGKAFSITADDPEVYKIATRCLERIRFEDQVGDIARDMPKYGEQIRQIVYVTPDEAKGLESGVIGVVALQEIDATMVIPRIEFGRLDAWEVEGSGLTLPPWDFWHTRLPGRSAMRGRVLHAFHGRSWLEPARPIWRALKVAEDSLLLARVTRAVNQRVFNFPAEGIPPAEIPAVIQEYKRLNSRRAQIHSTGEFAQRVNIFAYDEDLYWPQMPGGQGSVQQLGGNPDIKAIEDLRYWQDLMFAAIGVPREYLQAERSGGGILGKNLAMEDIRFARSVKKVQGSIARGLVTLLRIELALHGYDPMEEDFEVEMGTISFLEEQQRLEALEQATRVATSLSTLGQSTGLFQDPNWQDFVLDTIITFVGSSVGLEELREKVASGEAETGPPISTGRGYAAPGGEATAQPPAERFIRLVTDGPRDMKEEQYKEALRYVLEALLADGVRPSNILRNEDVPEESQLYPTAVGETHFHAVGSTGKRSKYIVEREEQGDLFSEEWSPKKSDQVYDFLKPGANVDAGIGSD